MTLTSTNIEFELIRNLIWKECGIFLKENKKYLIENRLSKLVLKSGCCSFGEYYRRVSGSPCNSELRNDVINAITTRETLWMRDRYPFSILTDRVFPYYESRIKQGLKSELNVWSAGCSTGQEPFSIIITALEFDERTGFGLPSMDQFKVLATDISTQALMTAEKGRYDKTAISRGMPEALLHTYFDKQDDCYTIKDMVKNKASFSRFNLKDTPNGIFGPFDVIFLRNVIIYFDDELKKKIFRNISKHLNPDGYLFLGTGESVEGYSERFICREEQGGAFYQLRYI